VIYWDTSAIIKLYVRESDSAGWQQVALGSVQPRVASALVEAEFAFALRHKEQRKELKLGGAAALIEVWRQDVAAGQSQVVSVSADVVARSVELARERAVGATLRTLDGLHLATALLMKCRTIATADRRLHEAARCFGLHVTGPGPSGSPA